MSSKCIITQKKQNKKILMFRLCEILERRYVIHLQKLNTLHILICLHAPPEPALSARAHTFQQTLLNTVQQLCAAVTVLF